MDFLRKEKKKKLTQGGSLSKGPLSFKMQQTQKNCGCTAFNMCKEQFNLEEY